MSNFKCSLTEIEYQLAAAFNEERGTLPSIAPEQVTGVVQEKIRSMIALALRRFGMPYHNEAIENASQEAWLILINLAFTQQGEGRTVCEYLKNLSMRACGRMRSRKASWSLETMCEAMSTEADPAEHAECQDSAAYMQEKISALPPHQRDAILMRYRDEMTIRDIAQAMGVTTNCITLRLRTAHARLHSMLRHFWELERQMGQRKSETVELGAQDETKEWS